MAGELQAEIRSIYRRTRERYRDLRSGFTPRQESLFQVLAFLTRFTLLAAPFYLVLSSGWEAGGLRAFTAEASAMVLRLAGIEASSTGSFVRSGEFLLDVTRDSTGWKSVTVFSALVLASRRNIHSKLKGIAAGAAVLLALNLLRITSMVYAVKAFGVNYEFLHTLLWRWGLTGGVIVLWAFWMRFSLPSRSFLRFRR